MKRVANALAGREWSKRLGGEAASARRGGARAPPGVVSRAFHLGALGVWRVFDAEEPARVRFLVVSPRSGGELSGEEVYDV